MLIVVSKIHTVFKRDSEVVVTVGEPDGSVILRCESAEKAEEVYNSAKAAVLQEAYALEWNNVNKELGMYYG